MSKRIQVVVPDELELKIIEKCKLIGHNPSSLGRWLYEQYLNEDIAKCEICGELYDRSILGDVAKHLHADIKLSPKDYKIKGNKIK